jgi:hypothetical protein
MENATIQEKQQEASDWREENWKKLVAYLPYSTTHTCAFCGKMGVFYDVRRTWPVAFLHCFLDFACKPTPFVHMVLMSLVFQSLKSDTWRDDKVILCKDCMDWALEICMYDEDRRQWKLIGKRIRFKRRNTKHHVCAYLPMDLLFLFLHAPSENRQLEYRMMCRLLKLLSKGSTQQPGLVNACLYAHMPFPVLQAVIHGIQAGTISLQRKNGMTSAASLSHHVGNAEGGNAEGGNAKEKDGTEKERDDNSCHFHVSQSIAMNVVMACHKASGQKRLVRNAPDVAKYIRKCSSLLSRHEQKQRAWDEWNMHGFANGKQLQGKQLQGKQLQGSHTSN